MRLTHVRLLASDFERMLGFYTDVLGFPVALAAEGIYAELKAGDAILAIYRRDLMSEMSGERLVRQEPSGASIVMTFQVADVDAARERLVEAGVDVTEPSDRAEAFIRVAHLRDPENNLLEINAPLRSGEEPPR